MLMCTFLYVHDIASSDIQSISSVIQTIKTLQSIWLSF